MCSLQDGPRGPHLLTRALRQAPPALCNQGDVATLPLPPGSLTRSGDSRLPRREDTQAALWRGPRGEELTPPDHTSRPGLGGSRLGTGHPEADSPAPVQPQRTAALDQHLDYNFMRNLEPEAPKGLTGETINVWCCSEPLSLGVTFRHQLVTDTSRNKAKQQGSPPQGSAVYSWALRT